MKWTLPILERLLPSGSTGLRALLKLVEPFSGGANNAIANVATLGDLVKPSAAAEQFSGNRGSRCLGMIDMLINAGK